MKKIIKLQAVIRGRLVRKKYSTKYLFAKELDIKSFNNYNNNNSEIRSINFGSDIINYGGLSNGANSVRNYNHQRTNNFSPYRPNSSDCEEKPKITLKNIVRKIKL